MNENIIKSYHTASLLHNDLIELLKSASSDPADFPLYELVSDMIEAVMKVECRLARIGGNVNY